MKKKTMIEQVFCDVCGANTWDGNACQRCGKHFCYDCREAHCIEYSHAVHFSGSGDGLYCTDCDKELRETGDKKHQLYLKIKSLCDEAKGWNEDFMARCKTTEAELEKENQE